MSAPLGLSCRPARTSERRVANVPKVDFISKSRSSAVLLAGDERIALEGFLDDHRYLISDAVTGLSETETRRSLVPSKTTLLGIVHHAAAVERFFFQRTLLGRAPADIDGLSDATDISWDLPHDLRVADAVAQFESACAESRRVAEAYPLEHVTVHNPVRGPLTVRWIYLRMIEELSRHAGQADILREQILAQRD